MIEKLTTPKANPIRWWHYDELRAEIVNECAHRRHPVEYLAKRFPRETLCHFDRQMKWLVRRWPEKRQALIESGEFRPAEISAPPALD